MTVPATALELIRQVLPDYIDVEPSTITPDTELAALGIDSLTLAELLFSLEDRLGKTIADTGQLPKLVSEVIAMIEPHLDTLRMQGAA